MSMKDSALRWWDGFAARHKTAAQFVKFYAFSMLVTVFQYALLTFLPGLFYRLTDWCAIPCQLLHLQLGPVDTYVFNYPVTGDETGGMGYFAAFAITLFLAQCINFPMQRNVTFHSKGNIWYQIFWYIIAFVLITVVCSFLMGLYVPLCRRFFADNGMGNFLNTVESRFATTRYFACSAIGHVRGTGPYAPRDAMEPISWILAQSDPELYRALGLDGGSSA